jgi:hypothetical protein
MLHLSLWVRERSLYIDDVTNAPILMYIQLPCRSDNNNCHYFLTAGGNETHGNMFMVLQIYRILLLTTYDVIATHQLQSQDFQRQIQIAHGLDLLVANFMNVSS